MRILSLQLKNIRSYIDETIEIPEGSTILSGDIGCGKTTILLAIEFALFGIMKGMISASSLLRHGKKEGHVELKVRVQDKEIIIRRNLKRSKNNIKQESGYIVANGIKTEGTATELKAKILQYLGYPDELLTKSKSLIYRYTVYTPQEEMKQILFESSEDRLNTIRKIFNIDKYKIIKENVILSMREIKQEKQLLSVKVEDYDKLKEEFKEKDVLLKKKNEEIKKIQDKLHSARKKLEKSKKDFEEYEEATKDLEKTKSHLELNQENTMNLEKNQKNLAAEIKELNTFLENKPKEVPDDEKITTEIKELQEKIKKEEEKLEKIRDKAGQLDGIRTNKESIIKEIEGIDECPTCQQDVTEEHKANIRKRENSKIEMVNENLKKLLDIKKQSSENLTKAKVELQTLQEKQQSIEVLKLKFKIYNDRKRQSTSKQDQLKQIQDQLKGSEEKKKTIVTRIEKLEKFKQENKKVKELFENAREEQHEVEIVEVKTKTEIGNLEDQVEGLTKDIKALEKIKNKIARLTDIFNWLDKFFFKLVDTIERQILLKVYNEFNIYFQEWFNTLIEDDNLNVKLNEDFSPAIEQNGYETLLENLSGGEKTSVALAYRLALFKIINDFVGDIQTRDIIILDEPTDGFSSDQLDRVRDVLIQLKTKQTIIVSHEQKVESFVDNILRIVKDGHVSRVMN